MRIFLDDVRDLPDNYDVLIRRAEDLIAILRDGNIYIRCISFDHDLGENRKTGYDVAVFIEKMAAEGRQIPIEYDIHSANPVGKEKIHAAMQAAYRIANAVQNN
jgi:hypothetical protein